MTSQALVVFTMYRSQLIEVASVVFRNVLAATVLQLCEGTVARGLCRSIFVTSDFLTMFLNTPGEV